MMCILYVSPGVGHDVCVVLYTLYTVRNNVTCKCFYMNGLLTHRLIRCHHPQKKRKKEKEERN